MHLIFIKINRLFLITRINNNYLRYLEPVIVNLINELLLILINDSKFM